jgi:repressor LexA
MATDKRAVFRFIVDYVNDHGSSPTIREIGDAFRIRSTNGVRHHLTSLERDGYIKLVPRKSRGIRVLAASGEPGDRAARPRAGAHGVHAGHGAQHVADRGVKGIPLVGRIAAGLPLLAEENIEDRLPLDELFRSEDLFALRVQGQSMKDRGILDGDIVVVHEQVHERTGDAVVALIGDDATLKTLRRTDEGIDLVPENPDFEVRRVGPDDDFRVIGVVVGVVRPRM